MMDQTEEERSVPYYKDGNTEVNIALGDTESVSATVAGELVCSTPNTAAEPEVDIQKQQPQQRSAVDGDVPYEFPQKEPADYNGVGKPTEDQPPPEGVDVDINGCGSQAALSEPTATPAADLNGNSNSDNAGMIRRSSSTQDVKPSESLADTGVETDGEEKDTGDEGETTGRDQQDGLRKVRRNLTKCLRLILFLLRSTHDFDVSSIEKHNKQFSIKYSHNRVSHLL